MQALASALMTNDSLVELGNIRSNYSMYRLCMDIFLSEEIISRSKVE